MTNNTEQILVIADPSFEKDIAIKHAIKLAKASNSKLHVVYFYHEDLRGLGTEGAALQESLMVRMDEKANDQLAQVIDDNTCTYDVVWSKHIHTWVNDFINKNPTSMVIKTGHRSETMFYTPTDWHLLRECPAPVLIISEEKWHKTPDILACIDLHTKTPEKLQLNHKILSKAKELANDLQVNLHVSFVPSFSTILRDLGVEYKDEIEQKALTENKQTIEELVQQYDISIDNFHIHAGKPESVIPSLAAKYHAGIVVIGTVGRSGVAQKLIGNTAENILSRLKTNVLALKP